MTTRGLGFRTFASRQVGVIPFRLIAIPLVVAAAIAFWNKAICAGLDFLLTAPRALQRQTSPLPVARCRASRTDEVDRCQVPWRQCAQDAPTTSQGDVQ